MYYGRYRTNEKNEFDTLTGYKKKYNLNILINASNLFLHKISNPEKKRKIIGNLCETFEKEAEISKEIFSPRNIIRYN